MGQYSKILEQKTKEELNDIFKNITTYTGEFIDDFLTEVDTRRMLWDMKILLSGNDLITITVKLESISNPKYLNLLKRELEIRGLTENYEQQKNGSVKADSKTKVKKLNYSVYGGIIIIFILGLRKYNEFETKQKFQDKIRERSGNPALGLDPNPPTYSNSGSSNLLNNKKVDFDVPKIILKKNPEIKITKIDYKKPDFSKIPNINKVTLDYNSLNSNLNPRFQKILDTLSK
jgi:hypothetical protein